MRVLAGVAAALMAFVLHACSASAQSELAARARALHRETPLIDGHNDFPWLVRQNAGGDLALLDIAVPRPALMTDLLRLRQGGVGGQFWSVYVPAALPGSEAVRATLEQIDVVHRMVRTYPQALELALTAADVERVFKAGRIASLIGMEGGHSIDNSLSTLRMFFSLGARYMTLTHSEHVDWADSASKPARLQGLSPFGEEVVREMQRLGMLVDLSHTSPDTMRDALRIAQAPVIFSHSSARGVHDHERNVPDDVLRLLPANGGVVMVTFVPMFVGPGASVARVADHMDHVRRVAGPDHVGIGSDFDGMPSTPVGLADVSKFPAVTEELLRRGWPEDDVRKALGLNLLRAMRAAEDAAARLSRLRDPSVTTIEALDPPLPEPAVRQQGDGAGVAHGDDSTQSRHDLQSPRRMKTASAVGEPRSARSVRRSACMHADSRGEDTRNASRRPPSPSGLRTGCPHLAWPPPAARRTVVRRIVAAAVRSS